MNSTTSFVILDRNVRAALCGYRPSDDRMCDVVPSMLVPAMLSLEPIQPNGIVVQRRLVVNGTLMHFMVGENTQVANFIRQMLDDRGLNQTKLHMPMRANGLEIVVALLGAERVSVLNVKTDVSTVDRKIHLEEIS